MYVIKKPNNKTFERGGVSGTIFPTKELTNKTQFLIIETQGGHQTTIIEKECVFCYYILNGNGHFLIDGNEEICKAGDLVIIPSGKPFKYAGNLRMLLNVTPPFKPEQEKVVEE